MQQNFKMQGATWCIMIEIGFGIELNNLKKNKKQMSGGYTLGRPESIQTGILNLPFSFCLNYPISKGRSPDIPKFGREVSKLWEKIIPGRI